MDDNSNIVRYKEDGTNYIVLRDSKVRDFRIELLNIRKFRIRKRGLIGPPRTDIDFIKDKLDVAHGSKGIILHVERNNITNRDGMFEVRNIIKEV